MPLCLPWTAPRRAFLDNTFGVMLICSERLRQECVAPTAIPADVMAGVAQTPGKAAALNDAGGFVETIHKTQRSALQVIVYFRVSYKRSAGCPI